MKISLLVVSLMVLAGCAETLDVTSYRSLTYSRERFEKRGAVFVLTDSKTADAGPREEDLADTRVVEDAFKQKGFSTSEHAGGADYIFTFTSLMKPSGEAIGLSVKGTFYELSTEGNPGRVFWDGRVAGEVKPDEWRERRREFLKAMLKKFPGEARF